MSSTGRKQDLLNESKVDSAALSLKDLTIKVSRINKRLFREKIVTKPETTAAKSIPSLIQSNEAAKVVKAVMKILNNPKKEQINDELIEFLEGRWQANKNTYLSYTHFPDSEASKICYDVANYLAALNNDKSASAFLMPTTIEVQNEFDRICNTLDLLEEDVQKIEFFDNKRESIINTINNDPNPPLLALIIMPKLPESKKEYIYKHLGLEKQFINYASDVNKFVSIMESLPEAEMSCIFNIIPVYEYVKNTGMFFSILNSLRTDELKSSFFMLIGPKLPQLIEGRGDLIGIINEAEPFEARQLLHGIKDKLNKLFKNAMEFDNLLVRIVNPEIRAIFTDLVSDEIKQQRLLFLAKDSKFVGHGKLEEDEKKTVQDNHAPGKSKSLFKMPKNIKLFSAKSQGFQADKKSHHIEKSKSNRRRRSSF